MLKDYFEMRKMRQLFGRYLPDDTVEKILNEGQSGSGKMKPAKIEFVFILLRDDVSAEDLSKQVGIATTLCLDFEATVSDICGPLVIAVFNFPRLVPEASEKRLILARKIRAELGERVKLVHGSAQAQTGNFGADPRCTFSFTFPGFGKALATLTQLDFGEISEFKP